MGNKSVDITARRKGSRPSYIWRKPLTKNKQNVPNSKGMARTNKHSHNDYKSYDKDLSEAIKLHELGVKGDKEAVKKCYELLKGLYEKKRGNYLVEAYFGSSVALVARDALNPNERFKLALEGLKHLDNAVSNSPNDIKIRMLRANVCLRLPEMYFHRTETAIEDFENLISRYEKNNSLFSKDTYLKIMFDLGVAYKNLKRIKEAHSTWEKLLTLAPDTKYKELIRQQGFSISTLTKNSEAEKQNEEVFQSEPRTLTPNKKKDLGEGIKLHERAISGDKEAIQKALQFFEKAQADNPDDPLIAAYYADCLSLNGKYAGDPPSMFGGAIKAIKIFDDAVNRDPNNIEIRLLRGGQSYRLPEAFFKRTATAITDFKYLVKRYEEDSSAFSKDLYCKILYLLGKAYQRIGMEEESNKTWKKLMSVCKGKDYREYISLVSKEKEHNSMISKIKDKSHNISSDKLLEEGIRLHNLAVDGNRGAAQKAFELLEKAYEKNPDDPTVKAYYGSSMALVGKYSSDSQTLFSNAIEGLKLLKSAVSKDSSNLRLRLLRGNLLYDLPDSFFHTSDKAAKDFRFIVSSYQRGNQTIPKEYYWDALYKLGVCYERTGDLKKANKTWKKLLNVTSDKKYKSLLKKKIEEGADL